MVGGSSPLSRGIRDSGVHVRGPQGIIPALAGNTSLTVSNAAPTSDHPRSRGEYHPSVGGSTIGGSSPLSRGIPVVMTSPCRDGGIIPALAGNTPAPHQSEPSVPDHPRSRGEYRDPECVTVYEDGSSPLSRGIRRVWNTRPKTRRIIPALAGNTGTTPTHSTNNTDHPRSRGEYIR